ncbi:MAG: hypothetical protein JNJ48_01095 [Phycisphaerae bacterium]|nr:hypothetical protein [Phycisphaerae bacterium]
MASTKPTFRLEWADLDTEPTDGQVAGPTRDDVRSIVEHLSACGSGFVILSAGDGDYIQAAAMEGDGLHVEYHEPVGDGHFQVADEPVSDSDSVALFLAWYDDRKSIADHADWIPMDL